jgi:DNA/RNA-binding domain of Phe-tRNA-synthetase-like protein
MSLESFSLTASAAWIEAWPGACVGAIAMSGVRNPEADPALEALLDETAVELRELYGGASRADLLARPELAAYAAYYRRFDKTYHVLLQLESVALKGKALRARGSLVAAMFRAEVRNGLLTAGHDADLVRGELIVDVARTGDAYTGIGGREIATAAGDMCIRDGAGIVSSIVYGPDDRTRLGRTTSRAIFTTYAPAGIDPESVRRHLESIAETVRVVSPEAAIDALEIVRAE